MLIRVSDALTGSVVMQPSWAGFEETVAELVNQLVSVGRLPAALATLATQAIREREAMVSTAMVDIGVSIPHARLNGINSILAAMAVSPGAVYQVAAGLPISIVALVLSSPASTGEHLSFLSALSLLLQSARMRERLRRAPSAEEVLRLIRSTEPPRR
jgi:PTS system nitrogen regulatory IIA component